MINLLLLLSGFFMVEEVRAEPWISARLAQNCSGCHSPGRRNLPPPKRRCTLSCQGCHANPSGGGLRTPYGKWSENHWLKSFRSKILNQKATTANLKAQKHYIPPAKLQTKATKEKIKSAKKAAKSGFRLVRKKTDSTTDEIKKYGRKADPYAYDIPAVEDVSTNDFLYHIAYEDPYRVIDRTKFDTGVDLRLATLKRGEGTSEDKKIKPFLMSADFGLRYRPLYRRYHLVYESRFQGSPSGQPIDNFVNTESTRSLYFMVDDLPYNVFVTGGYYRPLFGNYVADHYALSQVMQGQTLGSAPYNLLFKAFTVGTAPNVPYANIHYIAKNIAKGADDKTTGFAANLGLRFVSYGASVNYSLWSTDDKTDPNNSVKVLMQSVHAAMTLFGTRLISEIEFLSLERDNKAEDFRRGGVVSFATKFRFWRENYLTLEYAQANTNTSLLPGSAEQTKVGIKSFLIPGVEYSLQYNTDKIVTEGADTVDLTSILSMAHIYF